MRIRLFALAALVAGCHWSLNDKGTDPPVAQLYFPAGIAMDPAGQYVYVSNGNADLRFGGGTVMMIDMLAFECTIARFRQQHSLSADDAATSLPDACSRFSTDETFWDQTARDALCTRDPLDPSIIDCDETAFILQNSTVRIGNFAGTIRVLPDANNASHRTLFVAVRGDPSVTQIDVRMPGAAGAVAKDMSQPGVLVCVDNPQALATRSQYNAAAQKTSAPAPCDVTWLVQDYSCMGQPSCVPGTDQNNKTQLPTEPFNLQVDQSSARLLVSHLQTGQVSVIGVGDASNPASRAVLLSESQPFFNPDASGRHGAFAMAQQTPSDAHSLWYLTSNVNPLIATFRVGDSEIVIPQASFGLTTSFAQGTDVRDIVFDAGGNRAFVTENNPPTVVVIDTRPLQNNGSTNANVVTDIVDVCQTPSHMGVRRIDTVAADGSVQRKSKLVVVCFLSSQVMIVDPDRPGVDDTIFSGSAGPNDIAFNFGNPDDPMPTTQLVPRHAYVTNYSESTIAVVDLEPHSPTENRVLARLGMPAGGFNP